MWFIFALAYAFITSLLPFLNKQLTNRLPALAVLYMGLSLQVLFLGITLFITRNIPDAGSEFYTNIVIAGFIDAIAFAAAIEAIRRSQISLITPLGAFNPVFTAIFAAFVLREIPSPIKLLGIMLIVFGAYALNFGKIKKGFLRPIQELISHKGAQLFFLTNILWGITPIFQKNALLSTDPPSPVFTNFIGYIASLLFLAPFALPVLFKNSKKLHPELKLFLIIGILNTLSGLTGLISFGEGNVAYATAIFKLSILFTIAWGGLFLKEKNIREWLTGAGIMLAGTLLLLI